MESSASHESSPTAGIPSSDAHTNEHLKREYWCFLSYCHADNKEPGRQWATWLHQALETYEVPSDLVGKKNQRGDIIPERIFPVFRDEKDLSADAELSKPIEAALRCSRYLVILCSPRAAQSRFVADEILRFKQFGKQDRILAAIIGGEPNASDDPAKGGAEKECFPRPLRFAMGTDGQLTEEHTEPIAADFRLMDGTPGWTSLGAYREALKSAEPREKQVATSGADYAARQSLMLLKIVAGVLGVPLDVLTQRDKAYQLEKQKHRSRVLRRWLVAVGALAMLASALGWIAIISKNRASVAKKEAVKQRDGALNTLALSYHDRAFALAKTDWRQAMTYAAAALRLQPKSHLHSSLAYSLLSNHMSEVPVAVPLEGQRYFKTVFDPQGSRALACLSTGAPAVIDLTTNKRQTPFLPAGSLGISMGGVLSVDGGTLLVDGREAFRWLGGADLQRPPAKGMLLLAQNPAWSGGQFAAAAPQQNLIEYFHSNEGSKMSKVVQLLDFDSGAHSEVEQHENEVVAVLALPGERFLTIGKDKIIMLLDAKAGKHTLLAEALPEVPEFAVLSRSGQMAAIAHGASVTLIDIAAGFKQRHILGARDDVTVKSLAFSEKADHIAVGFHGPNEKSMLRVWHVPTGEPVSPWIEFGDKVKQLAFDAAGERIAGICENGKLFLCDLGGRGLGEWIAGTGGDAVAFVSSGTTLAVATEESVIQIRDPRQPWKFVQRRRLNHEVTSIVRCDDSDFALLVSDGGRQHQFWSITTQQSVANSVTHSDSIASARGFFRNGQPHAVLALKSGSLEVWNVKGERVASRTADPNLMEWIKKDAPLALENPEIKVVHCTGIGGDELDATSSPGRVGVARLSMNMDRLRGLDATAKKNGGWTDQLTASMWDLVNGEVQVLDELDLRVLETIPAASITSSCKLSKDGNVIVAFVASDAHFIVLQRTTGAEGRSTLVIEPISKTGMSAIADYQVAPDGRWLAAAGGFGAAVMDLSGPTHHWKLLAQGARVTKAQFSPDSQRLALDVSPTVNKGAVQIWDVATATPLSSLLEHEKSTRGMTFAPDSQTLITWSEDGVVKAWDTAGGRSAALPWETGSDITSAAVVSRGTALMFAGSDRLLRCAALPPSRSPGNWAPDFLESLARGKLDPSGNFLPVSPAQAVSQSPALDAACKEETGAWKDLAQCLANTGGAHVPGLPALGIDEELRDIERIFRDGDHTAAFMNLRELLRARPEARLPESLSHLASFVHHRRDDFFTEEAKVGRRAGVVMEGAAGLRFHWCPPGTFQMGSPAAEKGRRDDETPHRVVISRGFWMSENEITQGQWEQVMGISAIEHAKKRLGEPVTFPFGKNQSQTPILQLNGLSKLEDLDSWTSWFGADKPMMCVTYDDAVEFANRVNKLMPPVKVLGYWTGAGACRLPTEAEWEYACRAGVSTATYAGDPEYPGKNNDPMLSEIAWYSGNATEGVIGAGLNSGAWTEMERPGPFVAIHAVGSKKPNSWGLRDMLGNVNEWCLDNYRHDQIDGEVNPFIGINGANRVCRGFGINDLAASLRAAQRTSYPANWRSLFVGFRVILVDHAPMEGGK